MAFNLATLPAELRNLIIGHVAQLPAADLARASHVNKQWNANPLLLKAMLKTVPWSDAAAARLAAITSPVLDVVPVSAMAFDLAGLPQELRNHILGYVAQLPVADVARALRVNKQWSAHPLLLKALLKPMQGLEKRASYDVMCPECDVNTAKNDDFPDRMRRPDYALCVNTWDERRDDGTIVARSALACRTCLQYQYENVVAAIDPDQDLPAANEEDGSSICFILPVPGKDPVPVRELSVVREHGLVERPEHAQHYPLRK